MLHRKEWGQWERKGALFKISTNVKIVYLPLRISIPSLWPASLRSFGQNLDGRTIAADEKGAVEDVERGEISKPRSVAYVYKRLISEERFSCTVGAVPGMRLLTKFRYLPVKIGRSSYDLSVMFNWTKEFFCTLRNEVDFFSMQSKLLSNQVADWSLSLQRDWFKLAVLRLPPAPAVCHIRTGISYFEPDRKSVV